MTKPVNARKRFVVEREVAEAASDIIMSADI